MVDHIPIVDPAPLVHPIPIVDPHNLLYIDAVYPIPLDTRQ